MLYLPPRLAHHGVALGDGCMTLSVGFRAPSQSELLDDLLNERLLGERSPASRIHSDPAATTPD